MVKGAWVTLATNDSYSLGALVLAHSLKQVGTQQELAILVTPGVTNSMRAKLSDVFNIVKEVNVLDSKDKANLRLLQRPELGITFTKLHCWQLTEYEKCVFLDADTLVLQNCDELFEREELSAAPDVGWPDCFNSGVFVYRPSEETYNSLIQFALDKGSFDGGDQGLLNLYFADWARKDISKHLPFIYNVCSTAFYSYLPAFKQFGKDVKIIHFIGNAKPWLQYFDTESKRVRPSRDLGHLEPILQKWWNIFCSMIHPNLSPDMISSYPSDHVSARSPDQSSTIQPYNVPPSPIECSMNDIRPNVWDPWEEYDTKQMSVDINRSEHLESHNTIALSSVVPDHSRIDYSNPFLDVPSDDRQIHYNDDSSTNVEPSADDFSGIETVSESNLKDEVFVKRSCSPLNDTYEDKTCHVISEVVQESPNTSPVPSHSVENAFRCEESISDKNPRCSNPFLPKDSSHEVEETSHVEKHLPVSQSTEEIPPPPEILPISHHSKYETEGDSDNVPCEVENHVNESGLAGAFAKLTLGQQRTPEQEALEDSLRRQNWEQGNIDYLGKDSFDNIWSKICETLAKGPPEDGGVKDITLPQQEKCAPSKEDVLAASQESPLKAELNLSTQSSTSPPENTPTDSVVAPKRELSTQETLSSITPKTSEISESKNVPTTQPVVSSVENIPPEILPSLPEAPKTATLPVEQTQSENLLPEKETVPLPTEKAISAETGLAVLESASLPSKQVESSSCPVIEGVAATSEVPKQEIPTEQGTVPLSIPSPQQASPSNEGAKTQQVTQELSCPLKEAPPVESPACPIQAAPVKEASPKPSPPKEVQSCPIQATPMKEASSEPSPTEEIQSSPIPATPVKEVSSQHSPPKEVQSCPIQATPVKEASSKPSPPKEVQSSPIQAAPSPPKEVQSCPIQAAPAKEVSSKLSSPKEVQSSPIQAAPVKVISSETSPPKEAQSSPIQAAPSPPKEVQSSPIQAAPAEEVSFKPSPPKEIQDCPIQPPPKEVSSEPSPPLKTAPKKSDQCPPKEVTQPSEEKIAPPTQIELQKVVPPTTEGPSTPTQQVSIPASADTSNTGAASPVVSSEVPPPIAPPPRKSGGNKKQGKSKK